MEYLAADTLNYMHAHLAEPLTLKTLAARAHLTPAWFGTRFKAATGQTTYQALLQVRLTRAQELLRTTQQTVVSIALEVGFCDASHFAVHFRHKVGVTPAQYRWQAQAQESFDTLPQVCALWPRVGPEAQAAVLAYLETAASHSPVALLPQGQDRPC